MKQGLLFFTFLVLGSMAFADDIDTKIDKVLSPCVRVTTNNGQSGGSGTVLYSEDREKTGKFQTFILTNHHVIEHLLKVDRVWDNLTQSYKYVENNELADVELFTYQDGGRTVANTKVKAEVVAYKSDEDIALLKLQHSLQVKSMLKILPVDKPLRLFQEIYAVGCPLLVDPMFTRGQVTDIEYIIEKKKYTGGSAEIIWGNSGGAVITQVGDEFYFCGIPSHGKGAPNGQFVTYLGYYITPERINEFIHSQKLEFLLNTSITPTQSFDERKKMQKDKTSSEPPIVPNPNVGPETEEF